MDRERPAIPNARWAWIGPVGLAALLAAALFVGLGSAVPLGTHEGLLAETARNMVLDRPVTLADGSQPSPWLIPNFDGVMRLRKTPLPYWLAATSAKVTGEVNEWAVRFPSALAGAGTAVLVALVARRRYGRTSALLAAAALVTMVEFLLVSRRAIADIGLTFWMTACLAALWTAVERQGAARGAWLALAGALGGVAMLAKGPAPLVILPVPALVAGAVMIGRARRGTRSDLFWTLGGFAAAAVLFLAVTMPWYLYVWLRIPDAWAVWKAESLDRSVGDFGHSEPIYFYLVRLPFFVLPWTVFVGYGMVLAVKCVRRMHEDKNTRPASGAANEAIRAAADEATGAKAWLIFLGAWFVGPLAAFSVASGKQDHYIVPIFPAAALYVALAIHHLLDGRAKAARQVLIGHAAAFALAGIGAAVYFSRAMPESRTAAVVLGAILVAGSLVASWATLRRRFAASLAALLVTAVAAFLWSGPALLAPLDRSTFEAGFARKVKESVPPGATVYAVHGANGTLVFYSERTIGLVNSEAEIRERMAAGCPFYLIALDKDAKEVQIPDGLRTVYHVDNRCEPPHSEALWFWPGATAP